MVSRKFTKTLVLGSGVFTLLVASGAQADRAALEQAKTAKLLAQLEKSTGEIVTLQNDLNKVALNDVAFSKSVIDDLEKACQGKAKQDKKCTENYVANLPTKIPNMIRQGNAAANLQIKLVNLQQARLTNYTKNFQELAPKIEQSTISINKAIRDDSLELYNKLSPQEKNNNMELKQFLDRKQDLVAPVKIPMIRGDNAYELNSYSYVYNDKQDSFSILDFLIPPAHALEPVTTAIITTALVTAAAQAIVSYTQYKTSPPQLDKTAKCIDQADKERKSCDRKADKDAKAGCKFLSWLPVAQQACITTAALGSKALCATGQGIAVTACMTLPQ